MTSEYEDALNELDDRLCEIEGHSAITIKAVNLIDEANRKAEAMDRLIEARKCVDEKQDKALIVWEKDLLLAKVMHETAKFIED